MSISNTSTAWRGSAFAFASTIFTSAFLLFQVQPLIGKFILPWFGGTPAVWTTCMLVFQILLFAGYAYAHATTLIFKPREQAVVHLMLLSSAVILCLPVVPDVTWKPTAQDAPVWRIILLTLSTVGLPYFLLSATGPLLQRWFSDTHEQQSPYRLYALSNAGSLLALLSYPFLVEPNWSTPSQAQMWSWGFWTFVIMCGGCALFVMLRTGGLSSRKSEPLIEEFHSDATPPNLETVSMWFGLAMLPSVLLLAVTNQACMDVAVIPFLWVLPLALYLVSFILTFDAQGWYSLRGWGMAALISLALTCLMLIEAPGGSLVVQLLVYFGTLFCCCMVCHGELFKLKPNPQYLTAYYLTISAGGAAGGLSVAVFAPLVFTGYHELHLGLVAFVLLYFCVRTREEQKKTYFSARMRGFGNVGILFGSFLLMTQLGLSEGVLSVSRNFYGVLRIRDFGTEQNGGMRREMVHGRIVHGSQFLSPERSSWPTTYYGHDAGIGQLLDVKPTRKNRHVGVVGLGIGSLANYARQGDRYRFYEINPDVIQKAQEYFSCLKDSKGVVTIVEGDARLVLDREAPQLFDVLVVDAFSGDAIPVHLLTREAMRIYQKHLRPDGVLAIHISNMHFDLRPVVAGLARAFKLNERVVVSEANPEKGTLTACWVLMSANENILPPAQYTKASSPGRLILWTDERSNLFEVLH